MWYSLEKAGNDATLEHSQIQYTMSTDGVGWSEPLTVFQAVKQAPFWLGPGIDVIRVDGNLYLFYSGFNGNTNKGFYLYAARKK